MLELIGTFGFAAINTWVIRGIKSDKVLQSSFGVKAKDANSKEALAYYLNDVRRDAPFLTGSRL